MEAKNEKALRYRKDEGTVSEVIAIEDCSDTVSCSILNVSPNRGRMIEIGVRVRRVCPGRRTALGILLYELDGSGVEQLRGMRAMTIPAHSEPSCRDVVVEGIRFVLPEDVASAGNGSCGKRRFRVRIHAHYIDADDVCGILDR